MSGATQSNIAFWLKNVYGKYIIDSTNAECWAWDKLPKKAPEKITGNGFFFAVKFGRNQSTGPQTAGEALRAAGVPTGAQAQVTPKKYTGTIEMDNLTKAVTEGDLGSFVNGWDALMTDVMTSIKKDMNIDWWGDGTGKLTLVNGAITASTAAVFDTAQPIQLNGLYDFYDSTDTTRQAASISVSAVDLFNRSATLADAITCDNNAPVYRAGAKDGAPSDGKGMGGLTRMIDTTAVSSTYFTVSRAANINWQATVLSAASANISSDLLQRVLNRRRIRGGKQLSKTPLLLSHMQQQRKYLDLVTAQKRYNSLELDAGFRTLEFNGIPWIFEDVDAPEDTVFILDPEDLWKWELFPLGFDESDGKTIKWVSGYDKISAFVKAYFQVGVKNPILHAKITNLATPSI